MNKEKNIFNLTKKGLQINKELYPFPIEVNKLKIILGEPRLTEKTNPNEGNHIYTWDNLGIYVYSENLDTFHCIAFYFKKQFDFDILPTSSFGDILKIDNVPFENYIESIKDTLKPWPSMQGIKLGKHPFYISINESRELFDIQFSMPAIKIKKVDNKYNHQKISGEKINFSDFNFKLAVVQILMYEKELLKPKFDIEEFVELYDKREIDLDKDGYDFIPEVTNYFKKLVIEKKYALEITEIYQDGGNEVYLNLICFWDGEDNVFDIKSAKDADQFPNLKKVTLFGNFSKKLVEDFRKKGIAVN